LKENSKGSGLLIEKKYIYFLTFTDFEHTWWRLFQKRVVSTKFDAYVFIEQSFDRPTNYIFNFGELLTELVWSQHLLLRREDCSE
jgi:hypothetical protein